MFLFSRESANYTCVQQHTARKMLGRKDKKKERDYLPPSLLPFFSLFQESIRKGSASFLRTDLPVKTFLKENKFCHHFCSVKLIFELIFVFLKKNNYLRSVFTRNCEWHWQLFSLSFSCSIKNVTLYLKFVSIFCPLENQIFSVESSVKFKV